MQKVRLVLKSEFVVATALLSLTKSVVYDCKKLSAFCTF